MFSIQRSFLVIVLTMLQCIAPLVHAHASEHIAKQGLHLPGFELSGSEHFASIAPEMKSLQNHVSIDGMIIVIDIGVKRNQYKHWITSDSNYYLHQQDVVFNVGASKVDTNYSPLVNQINFLSLSSAHSSRAPPAY
ncbi:MAG: hypothetical protein RIT35_961 [Pseudomonadota bacterium]|jgi:hypothetical protein